MRRADSKKTVVLLDLDGTTVDKGQLNLALIETLKALKAQIEDRGDTFELKVLTSRGKESVMFAMNSKMNDFASQRTKDNDIQIINEMHQGLLWNSVSNIVRELSKYGLSVSPKNVIVGGDIWNEELDLSQSDNQTALQSEYEALRVFESTFYSDKFKPAATAAIELYYDHLVPLWKLAKEKQNTPDLQPVIGEFFSVVKKQLEDIPVAGLIMGSLNKVAYQSYQGAGNPTPFEWKSVLQSFQIDTASDIDENTKSIFETLCSLHNKSDVLEHRSYLKKIIKASAEQVGLQHEWESLKTLLKDEIHSERDQHNNYVSDLTGRAGKTKNSEKQRDARQKSQVAKHYADQPSVAEVLVFDDREELLNAMLAPRVSDDGKPNSDDHKIKALHVNFSGKYQFNTVTAYSSGDQGEGAPVADVVSTVVKLFETKKPEALLKEKKKCFLESFLSQQYPGEGFSVTDFKDITSNGSAQYTCTVTKSTGFWSALSTELVMGIEGDAITITPCKSAKSTDNQKYFNQLFLTDEVRYLNDHQHTQALKKITIPLSPKGELTQAVQYAVEFTQKQYGSSEQVSPQQNSHYEPVATEEPEEGKKSFSLAVSQNPNEEMMSFQAIKNKDGTPSTEGQVFIDGLCGGVKSDVVREYELYRSQLEKLSEIDPVGFDDKSYEEHVDKIMKINSQQNIAMIKLIESFYDRLDIANKQGYFEDRNGKNLFEKYLSKEDKEGVLNDIQSIGAYSDTLSTIDILKSCLSLKYFGDIKGDARFGDLSHWSGELRDKQIDRIIAEFKKQYKNKPEKNKATESEEDYLYHLVDLAEALHGLQSLPHQFGITLRAHKQGDEKRIPREDFKDIFEDVMIGPTAQLGSFKKNCLFQDPLFHRSTSTRASLGQGLPITVEKKYLKQQYSTAYKLAFGLAITVGVLAIAVSAVMTGGVSLAGIPVLAPVGSWMATQTVALATMAGGALVAAAGAYGWYKTSTPPPMFDLAGIYYEKKQGAELQATKKGFTDAELKAIDAVALKKIFFGGISRATEADKNAIEIKMDLFKKVCDPIKSETSLDYRRSDPKGQAYYFSSPNKKGHLDDPSTKGLSTHTVFNLSDSLVSPLEWGCYFATQLKDGSEPAKQRVSIMLDSDLVKKEILVLLVEATVNPDHLKKDELSAAHAILEHGDPGIGKGLLDQLATFDNSPSYILQIVLWMKQEGNTDNALLDQLSVKINGILTAEVNEDNSKIIRSLGLELPLYLFHNKDNASAIGTNRTSLLEALTSSSSQHPPINLQDYSAADLIHCAQAALFEKKLISETSINYPLLMQCLSQAHLKKEAGATYPTYYQRTWSHLLKACLDDGIRGISDDGWDVFQPIIDQPGLFSNCEGWIMDFLSHKDTTVEQFGVLIDNEAIRKLLLDKVFNVQGEHPPIPDAFAKQFVAWMIKQEVVSRLAGSSDFSIKDDFNKVLDQTIYVSAPLKAACFSQLSEDQKDKNPGLEDFLKNPNPDYGLTGPNDTSDSIISVLDVFGVFRSMLFLDPEEDKPKECITPSENDPLIPGNVV